MEIEEEMIPIVSGFLVIFSKEIFGLPLVRTVESIIDIIPEAKPICKPSYWMRIAELDEIRRQVGELLKLVFIRLSVLSFRAHVL